MKNLINKFISYQFRELTEKYSEKYPDSRFWVDKNNKVKLELGKSGYLYVYHNIWKSISDMFSLDYNETQRVIEDWVEEGFKLGSVTPRVEFYNDDIRVEEGLKFGSVTPVIEDGIFSVEVEEGLKLASVTPVSDRFNFKASVVEGLNLGSVTPVNIDCVASPLIEEGLKLGLVTPSFFKSQYAFLVEEGLKF